MLAGGRGERRTRLGLGLLRIKEKAFCCNVVERRRSLFERCREMPGDCRKGRES